VSYWEIWALLGLNLQIFVLPQVCHVKWNIVTCLVIMGYLLTCRGNLQPGNPLLLPKNIFSSWWTTPYGWRYFDKMSQRHILGPNQVDWYIVCGDWCCGVYCVYTQNSKTGDKTAIVVNASHLEMHLWSTLKFFAMVVFPANLMSYAYFGCDQIMDFCLAKSRKWPFPTTYWVPPITQCSAPSLCVCSLTCSDLTSTLHLAVLEFLQYLLSCTF
jgi:hypothetical protein